MLAVLAGCNKTQAPPPEPAVEPQKEQVARTFAFLSNMGEVTKVTLNSDNGFFWEPGDKTFVYSYNGDDIVCQDVSTIFSGEGTAVGRFAPDTYSELSTWYDPAAESLDYDFYAWYPFAPVEAPTAKVVSIPNVSATQTAADGIGSYLICWAKAETNKTALSAGISPNFTFAPKSALLKLSVQNTFGEPITFDSIQLDADANISGFGNLNLETGALSAGSSHVIDYTLDSPIVLQDGGKSTIPIYISMLPCAATSLSVILKDGENSYDPMFLSFPGLESGRVYSRVARYNNEPERNPERNVDIVNLTTKTATTSVLEANKLYYGKANCVVMGADDTRVSLNIQLFESADGFARSNITPTYTTAVTSAKIIWAENDLYDDPNFGIIEADLNTLTISKSSGITGNALVGIYQGEDLLWSYHIWCPSDNTVYQNFESEKGTVFDSVYKLSLGQIAGDQNDTYMFYQWGRKDPLGRAASLSDGTTSLVSIGGASFTIVAASSTGEVTNNLAYARKNPTTFLYRNNTSLHDWYPSQSTMTETSYQEFRLWKKTAATIYDPCPEGYHVAPKTLWEGTGSTTSSGSNFSAGMTTKLWYVLGGFRGLYANGDVRSVAHVGRWWSSDWNPGSRNAWCLFFNASTDLERASSSERAYGCAVRCVK